MVLLRRFVLALLLAFVFARCSDDSPVNDKGNDMGADDGNAPGPNLEEVVPEADNARIEGLVGLVSADSLESYVRRMVGFHTRHTNSDTVSGSQGIGAARRWVFDKFKRISDANGGRLRVSYHTFDATIVGVSGLHRNVVAELPGSTTPERKFVVSGHLDSRNRDVRDATNFAPGANDDGSGVAAVIELARVLSQFDFESTLIFVAVTGEEEGLFGSRALAQDLRRDGVNVVGMVTNDVVGNVVGGSGNVDSTRVRCFSEGPEDSANRQLARFIQLQGNAYVQEVTVDLIPARDRPGRGGDHFSFNGEGYTAARLTEPEDNMNHQHNMEDLPEFMSFRYLATVTKINAAYLASWADAPPSPTNVQVAEQNAGELRVSWQAPAATDVANYLLAVRSPGEIAIARFFSAGEEQAVTLQKPQGFDSGLFLSVAAVDKDGNESVFSDEVRVE